MAVVICSAVSAQAAQPVSNDSLKSVGLSNIVVMSDAQGTQVRAKFSYLQFVEAQFIVSYVSYEIRSTVRNFRYRP